MKNILAENLLRFGVKNLKENNMIRLKSLLKEQELDQPNDDLINKSGSGSKKGPTQIGNLQVIATDIKMNFDDAVKKIKEFGEGWRFPTQEEFGMLHKNMNKIPNIRYGNADGYWYPSYMDYDGTSNLQYIFKFGPNVTIEGRRSSTEYVMAVKDL